MEYLQREKKHLKHMLRTTEERLQKLRSVKRHRTKASIDELAALAGKWRSVAQSVSEQLLESSNLHPRPSLHDLLTALHIDPSLVHYCVVHENFY
ncbi:hypothetical protein GBAR_LOCUS8425 [Geodia barretti]|uniref:Swi5-dependent recombination DNA repair protein 1 homolog n=1 Tax=Geodia barretti TaxID=519541 RepID=A0AA35RKK1_GEOBA|nr:hypothetical protein GBAR_LOCUS8425 [Geodia barretti]